MKFLLFFALATLANLTIAEKVRYDKYVSY